MTAHVHPLPVDAVTAVDGWFSGLGPLFRGRLPPDDPLLRGGAGWVVSTCGRELAVVVDPTFPFSRPRVHVRGERPTTPHVERDGRLCLRNPEVPSDPAKAVASALGEARSLLRAIEGGSEDDDFQEDFGLYWRQLAAPGRRARLLLPGRRDTGVIAWASTGAAYYGFDSAAALRRWWRHRFRADPGKLRRGALVALDRLPHPDRYPRTGADLWDLVEAHSASGAAILGGLLRQMPKSLLVVLAGTAPSGRRHAVGAVISRPPDAKGRPATRRVIERDHPRGKAPPGVLCGRHQVTRLVTEALDAASSRLPYAERDRLANARVAVVGCGALGSGVARLLAKSGVGRLILVDPESLGWENIRRHQLGADAVGSPKATSLARAIAQENPDIGSTEAHDVTVEALLAKDPAALDGTDLVIACTAAWSANSALSQRSTRAGASPVLYAWIEAHALASHAVLIMPGHSYASGYDEAGNARITASSSAKPIPAECGGLTSPFGAIELAQAETLAGRLALDFLRGKVGETTWRTWLTDAAALADAEGRWTPEWMATRGEPDPLGGMSVGPWWDP